MMKDTEMIMMMNWGTWEELLLGGAVIRHGTRAWDAVASELRSRTIYPFSFTPEVCKAKYRDLRKRYCGCKTWFEELRKQRVAELKRELVKSEDSIGSLETKIESLKAEKVEDQLQDNDNINMVRYDPSPNVSPDSNESTERIGFHRKETTSNNSKDGLSASSFTEETRTNWSPVCQVPVATASNQEMDNLIDTDPEDAKVKPENLRSVEEVCADIQISNLRKRRGKRKRKDCSSIELKKETSVGENGESDVLSTAEVAMDGPDFDDQSAKLSHRVDQTVVVKGGEKLDLMKIFESFMENEHASMFCSRLDSQKRARYKNTIRRHMDFNTIRAGISNGSIKSTRELYRDILLLTNNAINFYSKNTRQYTFAISLRNLAKNTFQQIQSVSCLDSGGDSIGGGGDRISCEAQQFSLPVKPRSIRPHIRKVIGKLVTEERMSPKKEGKKSQPEVEDMLFPPRETKKGKAETTEEVSTSKKDTKKGQTEMGERITLKLTKKRKTEAEEIIAQKPVNKNSKTEVPKQMIPSRKETKKGSSDAKILVESPLVALEVVKKTGAGRSKKVGRGNGGGQKPKRVDTDGVVKGRKRTRIR
ncbi:hypothetical protein C5167_009145 [Papaver somniferum]|uniref:Bromo domain-containing protein n=1 Tax=Papaver somniferum TaxID=3469 RepID=A0A4Y7K0G7_PAPSO|nr:uncharacterized protein LOC113287706 [Papaver somniferum]RZC65455.1 hypothetical protein C5167_009145 [Papaver somniferum]